MKFTLSSEEIREAVAEYIERKVNHTFNSEEITFSVFNEEEVEVFNITSSASF
jgi:hypothetical protein